MSHKVLTANKFAVMLLIILSVVCNTAQSEEALLWFRQGKPATQAIEAVHLLNAAGTHGLDREDYDADAFQQVLQQMHRHPLQSPGELNRLDAALSAAMQRYLQDVHQGRLFPSQVNQYYQAPATPPFDVTEYLQTAVAINQLTAAAHAIAPSTDQYARLQDALFIYRTLSDHPAWTERLAHISDRVLRPGQTYTGTTLLAERLALLGDLDMNHATTDLYDDSVVTAVRSFQERHGLLVDGLIGNATLAQLEVTPEQRVRQIELNMERLRWTPFFQAPRMVVINIPEFTLRAYNVRDDQPVIQAEMRIIVGRALNTRTPLFDGLMQLIEFSPYWNVPPSIARSETFPRLRKDPDYFERQGFEFVDDKGQVIASISEETLQAAEAGEIRVRQRPGPANAMGDIKFIFPNDMNIFLHHTSTPALFDRHRRDFSHGCIRVEEPVALAQFVLQNQPQWTEERITEMMSTRTSKTIRLDQPIPVLLHYSTAVVKNDKIYFLPDLYDHDVLLDQALRKQV